MGHRGSFGFRLKQMREARCLTQRELSESSGVSVATIRDIEQGRTRNPRATSVRALAEALRLSAADMAEMSDADAHELTKETSPVYISVLGPLSVTRGGSSSDVPEHVGLLLTRLAMTPNERVAHDTLHELLWPDLTSGAATKRMGQLLRRLRALIAPITVVHDSHGLLLAADADELDMVRLQVLTKPKDADLEALRSAAHLWSGRPDRIERAPWLMEAVENTYVGVVLRWVALAMTTGDPAEPLPVLSELVRTRPLDEPLWGRTTPYAPPWPKSSASTRARSSKPRDRAPWRAAGTPSCPGGPTAYAARIHPARCPARLC